jgi:hypothetical protein
VAQGRSSGINLANLKVSKEILQKSQPELEELRKLTADIFKKAGQAGSRQAPAFDEDGDGIMGSNGSTQNHPSMSSIPFPPPTMPTLQPGNKEEKLPPAIKAVFDFLKKIKFKV